METTAWLSWHDEGLGSLTVENVSRFSTKQQEALKQRRDNLHKENMFEFTI